MDLVRHILVLASGLLDLACLGRAWLDALCCTPRASVPVVRDRGRRERAEPDPVGIGIPGLVGTMQIGRAE